MTDTLQTAILLRQQGIACIPVDTHKRPRVDSWKRYQESLPSEDELTEFFSNGAAVALVAGSVQCLDIDVKHYPREGLFRAYRDRCEEFGLGELFKRVLIQRTPSGGYHLVFSCSAELRNEKLAWVEDNKAIFETRGAGGYFLISPSDGYMLLQGEWDQIPEITEEERDHLFAVARTFGQGKLKEERASNAGTPGDDFDARCDMPSLLQKHGWKRCSSDGKYWTRPGKNRGVSASWDVVPGRFWCFTSSTAFEPNHVYRPWHVYAILEHGGDFSRAAAALAAEGYGAPRKSAQELAIEALRQSGIGLATEKPVEGQETAEIDLPAILSVEEEEQADMPEPPQVIQGVLYQGAKMMIAGPSKARKTYGLMDLALSVGSGMPWLGFPTTQTGVLYINFELQNFASRDRKRHMLLSKFESVECQVYFWHLRGALARRGQNPRATYQTIVDRMGSFCQEHQIGLIIVDPVYKLMQLAGEENKAEDVGRLLNELDMITVETGAAVAFVHHFAKGNSSSKDAIDRASGSGVWARDPDALFTLTPHEDDDCMVVDAALRNFKAVEPFGIRWQFPLWERDNLLDPSALKQVKKSTAKGGRPRVEKVTLLDVLPQFGGCVTASNVDAIADEMNVSPSTVWRRWREQNKLTQ